MVNRGNAMEAGLLEIVWAEPNDDATRAAASYEGNARAGTVHIERTASLAETLARLEMRSADALVLDLLLPDVPGLRALRRVRRSFPDLPIVVLVPEGSEALAGNALAYGLAQQAVSYEEVGAGRAPEESLYFRLHQAIERTRLDQTRLHVQIDIQTRRMSPPANLGAVPQGRFSNENGPCRKQVLLADEPSYAGRTIVEVLRREQVRVEMVSDGCQVVEKVLTAEHWRNPYAAVVIDVEAPQRCEALFCLKEAGYDRPIIGYHAGAPSPSDAVLGACDGWLKSPLLPEQLRLVLSLES